MRFLGFLVLRCHGNTLLAHYRAFWGVHQTGGSSHRPLGEQEQLDDVFTWQEDRRLTNNLTLHYKRVMYVIAPCPEAEEARGGRVQISETHNGEVVISYRGTALACRAFEKDVRVRQGAVVDNKVLGDAFEVIQEQQKVRDAEVLRQKKLTLREEDLMRKAMGDAGLPNRRKDAAAAETNSNVARSPTAVIDDLLAAALSLSPAVQSQEKRKT